MTLRWQCPCIDSRDPRRAADFWQHALGWRCTHDTEEEVVLEPPAGSPEDGVAPDLLFLRVPDRKTGKNRLHIDLRPEDHALEVARLESLGARRVDIGQGDQTWTVLADPDGNEFCVLRAFTAQEREQLARESSQTLSTPLDSSPSTGAAVAGIGHCRRRCDLARI